MKKILLPLAALLLGAGCVVRSIHPWLSDETRVDDPSLLGGWHDARHEHTAFFAESTNSSDFAYSVLLVQKRNETSHFMANLHRLDDVLLLVAGPAETDGLGTYVRLPGHLLFKAVLAGDSLELFEVDLDSFGARAAQADLSMVAVASTNEKPSVLTATTATAEAFVRAQLADPTFFAEKPLYSFRKLPGSAD